MKVIYETNCRTGIAIQLILFVTVALSCLFPVCVQAQERGPNIVFFLVDDLGPDELVCYASKFHETPNIDALASQGMRFTNAYSGSTLCSPSRAAILTGRHPARLHLTDWIPGQTQINVKSIVPDWKTYIDPDRVLLPEALKEQGYATGFFGKWHLMPKPTTRIRESKDKDRMAELTAIFPEHYPEKHGFDENYGGDQSANQGKRFLYPATKRFRNLQNLGKEGDCVTDILTDCAVDFIERKKDQPFLVYLSYYTVHGPITGKPEYVKKYKQKLASNPDANYHMKNPGKAAMIQSLDESVGRVVAKLKETGELDETLIIFTGDNGSDYEEWVVNARGMKGTPYEGGTRVPLIVTGPGVETGVCNVPTIGMDFYPTLLSYVDAPPKPNEHVDGVDITSLFKISGAIEDRPLYWHYPHYDKAPPYSSIIVDRWKLIHQTDDDTLELYNLKNDPMEKENLAAYLPRKRNALLQELDEILNNADAQRAERNPAYDPNRFSGGIRKFKVWGDKQ
jgi:arylsulfatase A